MPNAGFKCMMWFFKFIDVFWNPRRRLEKMPLKEGMVVVDYGCGPGRYTLPVAKLVGPESKVFAVDIQPLAISTVRKKMASEALTNLLIDTFHMIKDRDALFHEIHRILKQDGILFMDPGHMKISRAREIVESTDLFTIAECRGKDMLVVPKTKQ